jgi:3-methyladenine DNA glycosylase AlkD
MRETKPTKTTVAAKSAKPRARMTLDETMSALERAGSAQTRKTYARHGVTGAMFGVSFATLKELTKRIGIDHELALALWDSGNYDARNLAVKVVDPTRMTSGELDRWATDGGDAPMCSSYVGMIAGEGRLAAKKLAQWLATRSAGKRLAAWSLLSHLAMREETLGDELFADHLATIEDTLHAAPNRERYAMNSALIAIGCRNAALKKLALAAAKRIGVVDVDHGDTSCKTPDAAESIAKAWAHATAKKFASPAAQERAREVLRRRC